MSEDGSLPLAMQLALLRRDIQDIKEVLHGDGKRKVGIVAQVEELMEVSDRGRWSLRIALWVCGAIVGLFTLAAQLKSLLFGDATGPMGPLK